VFPAGTTAEVGTGYNDISRFYGRGEVRVDILHAVGGQRGGRRIVQVSGGNNHVSVHVSTVFINLHI
jgi:hypothetical protein